MHDAKQTMLSKIQVGDKILVVDGEGTMFGFGRPKDPTAKFRAVTKITHKPDQWTGKVYTVQITGGRRNEGRYGTTHVYVANAPAEPSKGSTIATDEGVVIAETRHVELEPQVRVELTRANDWRRVRVDADGTMRITDWKGGDYEGTTPHGKRVHVTPDGVLTVIEDDGTERPAVFTSLPDDELDEANAGEPDVATATAERCGQCKGYGVVRKYGSNKNHAYKTLNGAEQATVKGNSVKCPTCKGAAILLASA